MNLHINSPSYYTTQYGVCDEIYQMCSLISRSIDVSKYTDCLDTIGILPIIAPKDLLDSGKYTETELISLTYRYASISISSDYDVFLNADIDEKKDIILHNIFNSLLIIKKRLKNQFDYKDGGRFYKDGGRFYVSVLALWNCVENSS